MWQINLEKCLRIFENTYVTSDSKKILDEARWLGAIPILRGEELCGDCPNVNVYKYVLQYVSADAIVAVQANSPTIDPKIIKEVKSLLEKGCQEVMTSHPDGSIYGSVWGIDRETIKNYKDPYNPKPNMLIEDPSIDVHTLEDYNLVEQNFK